MEGCPNADLVISGGRDPKLAPVGRFVAIAFRGLSANPSRCLPAPSPSSHPRSLSLTPPSQGRLFSSRPLRPHRPPRRRLIFGHSLSSSVTHLDGLTTNVFPLFSPVPGPSPMSPVFPEPTLTVCTPTSRPPAYFNSASPDPNPRCWGSGVGAGGAPISAAGREASGALKLA